MADKNDQTMREDFSASNNDGTILEAEATVRESGNIGRQEAMLQEFRGLEIIRQFKTAGSEADIFLVRDKGVERVLKLYRFGINPGQEMLEKYSQISRECPRHIIQVYDAGFDKATGRFFELLEYAPAGSLADFIGKGRADGFDFREFVEELSTAVGALHEHGIIHRDLKPGNILIRSIKPLDLALGDFGISSLLEADASIRETARRGFTPMYAASEDCLGLIVSRPADWWACGMIFYELLNGSHPFAGLSPNRINYILSTRGVEIDGNLPEREKLLLKGLLTRNDKKRWGLEEIQAWLKGKEEIPCYYELDFTKAGACPDAPFAFLGKNFSNLHDLACAFAAGHESWQAARGSLSRGNVAKWLQNRNQFDEERILVEEVSDNDPDLYLYRFIAKFAPDLPFNMYGQEINAKNLLAWLLLPEKERSGPQQQIITLLLDGKLKDLANLSANLEPALSEFMNFTEKQKLDQAAMARASRFASAGGHLLGFGGNSREFRGAHEFCGQMFRALLH